MVTACRRSCLGCLTWGRHPRALVPSRRAETSEREALSKSTTPEPGVAPATTWDDWLVKRPEPEPTPGETLADLTGADAVAFQLSHGLDGLIDFSRQSCRDGMRQLFDEFESATAAGRGMTPITRPCAPDTPLGARSNDEMPQPQASATDDGQSSEPRVQR